jgi:F-type H+-transporting ATPase subunit epsilon
MAKFHFDLVGPEKLVFSGEVDQVDVPGTEGDFGVLAGHAPVIAMLRPGVLTIYTGSEQIRAFVTGGFAEANPTSLTVLADSAVAVDDLDRAVLAGKIKDLEEDIADAAEGPARDRAAHKLDQLKAVQAALGH